MYFELYNTSGQDIDITGYNFPQGVTHTFDQFILEAGAYLIICESSSAMSNVFGIDNAIQWNDGALQNGGETIEMADSDGNVLFTVAYDDSGDWPGSADGTDGEGASIELCDQESDSTNPFNWSASESNTGIMLNGREIRATPGAANNVMCREDVEIIYTKDEIVNIKDIDADGVALRLGEFLELEGVVYGVNLQSGGLNFTIIDNNNNGVAVYNPDNDLGYNVVEGDRVSVFGQLVQFSGLTRLEVDSVSMESSSNPLLDPEVVTMLNEGTESSLVKIENLSLVDPSEWEGDGGSFNVMVTNGSDEFQLRIWSATDMSELPAPQGLMSVTGIGGQFDQSSPFTEGYQLQPRYISDIEADDFGGGPTYTQVNITDINGEDSNGVSLNLEDLVEVTAITYGINFRPGGLQFTIIDENNNGIGVFSSADNFGYEFNEGDEVTVFGEVEQFFGLTQIRLDSIALVSEGNQLISASPVTILNESTESSFVVFQGVEFPDPSMWLGDGSSFNIDFSDGSNVIDLRIDSDSDLASSSIPDAASFVYGIGGQFDNSGAPLDAGYQMFPLFFEPYLSSLDILPEGSLVIFPNPSTDYVNVETEHIFDRFQIYDLSGREQIRTVNTKIDIRGLEVGSYILIAKNDKYLAKVIFQKF